MLEHSMFTVFFPPLNCSHTESLTQIERNRPCPWIAPASRACWWARLSSTVNCSITRIAPQHAAIYLLNRSYRDCMAAQSYSIASLGWFITITQRFLTVHAETLRSTMHTQAWKCSNINWTHSCIVSALNLYPHPGAHSQKVFKEIW